MVEQFSLFPSPAITDPRPPETITWNLWHGCTRYVEDYITCVMCFYSYVEQAMNSCEYLVSVALAPH